MIRTKLHRIHILKCSKSVSVTSLTVPSKSKSYYTYFINIHILSQSVQFLISLFEFFGKFIFMPATYSYPQSFHNFFSLGVSRANITITDRNDLNIWDVFIQSRGQLDNNTIDLVSEKMLIATQGKLEDDQLTVLENVMNDVIDVAETKP